MRTHFKPLWTQSRYFHQRVLQKARIYNITPFATKFCMFIMVEMLYILFARRCMLNKILVEISVRYNLTGSA